MDRILPMDPNDDDVSTNTRTSNTSMAHTSNSPRRKAHSRHEYKHCDRTHDKPQLPSRHPLPAFHRSFFLRYNNYHRRNSRFQVC